jgi:hypothetical protein
MLLYCHVQNLTQKLNNTAVPICTPTSPLLPYCQFQTLTLTLTNTAVPICTPNSPLLPYCQFQTLTLNLTNSAVPICTPTSPLLPYCQFLTLITFTFRCSFYRKLKTNAKFVLTSFRPSLHTAEFLDSRCNTSPNVLEGTAYLNLESRSPQTCS